MLDAHYLDFFSKNFGKREKFIIVLKENNGELSFIVWRTLHVCKTGNPCIFEAEWLVAELKLAISSLTSVFLNSCFWFFVVSLLVITLVSLQ